jgi:hypothetical protein
MLDFERFEKIQIFILECLLNVNLGICACHDMSPSKPMSSVATAPRDAFGIMGITIRKGCYEVDYSLAMTA